jgi:hypothetical protein
MTFTEVPRQPAFCFITPIAYLNQFATKTSRHLVLAHLVDRHPEYAQFYKERSEQGDYIMMDNSAYELHEPYQPKKLIELARLCGAHAIVLPDYPFQPSTKTIEAAEEFAPIFKAEGFHNFFVPQSQRGDLNDWITAYKWADDNPDIDIIGMSILGIPNAMPVVDPAYARVVMTTVLQTHNMFSQKAHHYLGLNSGPGLEIPSLLRLNALTSIDSSGPVWAGIQGHRYTTDADSLQMVKKLKSVVDFNIPVTKDRDTLERIAYNVDLTLALFTNTEVKDWFAKE